MKLVIVTGMSGAGKSTAMKMMEDMGFFCIDNLPAQLVTKLIGLNTEMDKIALGIDVRSGEQPLEILLEVLEDLDKRGISYDILYLESEDEVLVKRYKETRRNHPLASGERIDKGITREREQLSKIKKRATYIIDTSQLLTSELKMELEKIFVQNKTYKNLFVTILSFGFKYGIPADADIVMDVRFLPNPYYVEGLRAKTGNEKEIRDYVMQFEESTVFLDKLEDMVRFLIPNYIAEGKSQLVIAIGCTGGKHRSVTLANGLYDRLCEEQGYGLKIEHRDIGKDALRGK